MTDSLYGVNPFPNKPLFLRVCSSSLLKTQWEKGEITPFRDISTIFFKFKKVISKTLSVWKHQQNSFSLEASIICHLGRGSVVSSCILVLFPVRTNHVLMVSLRWATGSDDK